MAGYVIADVDVTAPELFAKYRDLVGPTVEKYGGEYLARGGDVEVLEGDRVAHRTVIIRFDSAERAREWYHSDEYAPALKMRLEAANSHVLIVDGA
ncbi:MAG: DUF1330 domain-containing protein [Chloroflexota bacterium]|nr:DUF1330 domain-containing protein [Chloroflexota bacterium]